MPMCEIKDHKTGETIKALNFGGDSLYQVNGKYVWAPKGGTSISETTDSYTLSPHGIHIGKENVLWQIIGHDNVNTCSWRVTVKNQVTNEIISGVYPFNVRGKVYELECQPGTWVMASCGGYKIEASWVGKTNEQCYRLKGTGEIIKKTNYTAATYDDRQYSLVWSNKNRLDAIAVGNGLHDYTMVECGWITGGEFYVISSDAKRITISETCWMGNNCTQYKPADLVNPFRLPIEVYNAHKDEIKEGLLRYIIEQYTYGNTGLIISFSSINLVVDLEQANNSGVEPGYGIYTRLDFQYHKYPYPSKVEYAEYLRQCGRIVYGA